MKFNIKVGGARAIGWVALAGVAVPAVFLLAFESAGSVSFRFGPADRDYVAGFRAGWERGTTSRWSRERAAVTLPISIRGDAE
ncbi:MAG: hypothetical protein ACRD1Z_10820, partial [Vicinamibacteria bacterium]